MSCYIGGNGRTPLFDRDEPRYAVTSAAMGETGDLVVPRFLGEVRTAKPPAIYWLQAGAMAVLGETDFSVRLPSALCATAAVAVLRYGLAPAVGRRRARWAAFVTGTAILTVAAAKLATTDAALLLCAGVAWVGLIRGRFWTTWLAVGVGGLVKGPVLLGVVLATLTVLSLSRGRTSRRSGHAKTIAGVAVALLVCLPWMALVEARSPGFLTASLSHDVLARSTGGLEGHGRPPGFHLLLLPATFFPWSLLLPAVLVNAWRRRRRLGFAVAGAVGPWLMFEAVATKLPHYVLPLVPMLALLTADWIVAAGRGRRPGDARRLAWTALAAAAVAAGLTGAAAWFGIRVVVPCVWAAAVLAMAFDPRSPPRRRVGRVCLAMGAFAPSIGAVLYAVHLPRVEALTVPRRAAAALGEAGATEAAMVGYKEPSLAWYAGRLGVAAREADDFAGAAFAVTDGPTPPGWEAVAAFDAPLYNDGGRRATVRVIRRSGRADNAAARREDRQAGRIR